MEKRLRLGFLDGMRGVAALYVLLQHVRQEWEWRFVDHAGVLVPEGDKLPGVIQKAMGVFDYGHFAVAVFIVLSGYCLMMPVCRQDGLRLAGGLGRYIKRRSRRILPPYYAALFFSLLAIASVPMLREAGNTRWGAVLPAFTPGVLISHLLLVHNLNPQWSAKINSPMWSVPPEWQIYFLFPLVLLPMCRRLGFLAMNAIVCIVTIIPHFLFHGSLDFATPWYVGLFSFGMTGAMLNHSNAAHVVRLKNRVPWGWLALLLCTGCGALFALKPDWSASRTYATDPLVGICTAVLIVHLAEPGAPGRRSIVRRLFDARLVVWLGTISYSVYLIHYPLLPVIHAVLRQFGLPPTARLFALFGAAVVVSVGAAYVFHLCFERPFMIGHPKTDRKAATSAAMEPAI